MDIANWIVGLMRENYEAVGFIPQTTVANRYVGENQYILQNDERGRAVGYLLHGKLAYAKPVVVSQHCIQYEKRLRGYGQEAFREFLHRCSVVQVSSIHLRVAQDLPAVEFWQSCGFVPAQVVPGGESRNRSIVVMRLALALPFTALLSNNCVQADGACMCKLVSVMGGEMWERPNDCPVHSPRR